jgi:hypothetical protein
MTWPPAASIRAAAAITSITMNGGTSLRRDGASNASTLFLTVASRIDICYFAAGPDPGSGKKPGVHAPHWPHCAAH